MAQPYPAGQSILAAEQRPPADHSLAELLEQPEIRLLMHADNVDAGDLLRLLEQVARRIGADLAASRSEGDDMDDTHYRPGIGVVLLNERGDVFLGRRADVRNAWQLPQGGVEPGEDPRAAALRELREEIGTDNVEAVAETQGWFRYDLPDELVGKAWGGRWKGQRQKWFVMRFLGSDEEINIATAHPEFDAWRWASVDAIADLAVSFKRPVYRSVLSELGPLIRSKAP